MLVEV